MHSSGRLLHLTRHTGHIIDTDSVLASASVCAGDEEWVEWGEEELQPASSVMSLSMMLSQSLSIK
jgi:hypothetical protein